VRIGTLTLLFGLSLALPSFASDSVLKTLKLDSMHEPAPDFEYANADGKKHKLSDLKGHAIILHFWASWCTSCQKELPDLQIATRKWAKDQIIFLPVSVEGTEKKTESENFLKKNAPELSVLIPTEAKSVHTYWAWGLPATYLMNTKGELVARALGARDWTSVPTKDVEVLLGLHPH
jgi:thiol-disulfide isomerase/thioredoxin